MATLIDEDNDKEERELTDTLKEAIINMNESGP